ncbi:hypothetical protein [Streptomyces sp. NPDC000133]|uniref:hypothetical protein n=1 Tax=Streptomyces sp. NPDC000133 TaxID=3364535 RepID=UPI0036CEAD89
MATPSLLKESATEPARADWERRTARPDERQRTLTVLAALELDGTRITFTAVAYAAGVSTWLTYTSGVREHIEAARRCQHASAAPARHGDPHTAPAALRTELDPPRDPATAGRPRSSQNLTICGIFAGVSVLRLR